MMVSRSHGMHVGRNSAGRWVVFDNAISSYPILSMDYRTRREAEARKRELAR